MMMISLHVINLVVFSVVLIIYQLLRVGRFEPYRLGFFCDDKSTALPYKESTVPSSLNVGLSISIPLLTVRLYKEILPKTILW